MTAELIPLSSNLDYNPETKDALVCYCDNCDSKKPYWYLKVGSRGGIVAFICAYCRHTIELTSNMQLLSK